MDDDVVLRRLLPTDETKLRLLHEEWFPLRYKAEFYAMATADPPAPGTLSVAAVDRRRGENLAGVAVARVVLASTLDADDAAVRALALACDRVVYIQTIGVAGDYRRRGLGRLIMQQLVATARGLPVAAEAVGCRLMYLHVLATNTAALQFYEMLGFRRRALLPRYYDFAGAAHDALTYVLVLHELPPAPCCAVVTWSAWLLQWVDQAWNTVLASRATRIGGVSTHPSDRLSDSPLTPVEIMPR